jgi:hypothetical protein
LSSCLLCKNIIVKIYKTIILPVTLYRCETHKRKNRLRVFENRVLRRIFGPKRKEVAGSWRKLHNVELHNLYTSPNIIRVIKSRRVRWVRYVACVGEMKNAYAFLVRKPEGKRPLGRPRHRWKNNI